MFLSNHRLFQDLFLRSQAVNKEQFVKKKTKCSHLELDVEEFTNEKTIKLK